MPEIVPKVPRKRKSTANHEFQKQFVQMVSSLLSRRELAQKLGGQQFEGQRDLYAVLGYQRDLTFDDFQVAYDREDIAARIVDAKPESTWRRRPVVSNDSDPDSFTEFETAWAKLVHKRRVFHYLERADKLAGIGEYGILLIGTGDVRATKDMERPMAKLRRGVDDVLYLTPFNQKSAEIGELDMDPRSERFGLPLYYNISVAGADNIGSLSNEVVKTHWTRVIHIAEGLQENDYIGTPRLRPVINRLHDVQKIAGGSAEVFWQVAKRIMVLSAKEGFTAVDTDDSLTQMMDELIHGLRRVIDIQGYDIKMLENSDVKPDEAFRVALALISSATGIPQRILLGSEQGKMASTQDEVNWNGRIADRQINHAEPMVLRPFIDRMILFGGLPRPENDYIITWPSLFELSDKEKAQIGLLKSRALKQYTGKAGEDLKPNSDIVPPDEFRGEFLNLRARKVEISETKGGTQKDNPKPAVPETDDLADNSELLIKRDKKLMSLVRAHRKIPTKHVNTEYIEVIPCSDLGEAEIAAGVTDTGNA